MDYGLTVFVLEKCRHQPKTIPKIAKRNSVVPRIEDFLKKLTKQMWFPIKTCIC